MKIFYYKRRSNLVQIYVWMFTQTYICLIARMKSFSHKFIQKSSSQDGFRLLVYSNLEEREEKADISTGWNFNFFFMVNVFLSVLGILSAWFLNEWKVLSCFVLQMHRSWCLHFSPFMKTGLWATPHFSCVKESDKVSSTCSGRRRNILHVKLVLSL